MNLPPEDNLRKEDKSSAPKLSFIRRFHCISLEIPLSENSVTPGRWLLGPSDPPDTES